MIVVDASALVEVVLGTPAGDRLRPLLLAQEAFAPDLIDAECFSVLARAARQGLISAPDARERIDLVRSARVERMPSRSLLPGALRFTTSLSGYDALYAAAAEALSCAILTTDRGLAATAADQFGLAVTHVPVHRPR